MKFSLSLLSLGFSLICAPGFAQEASFPDTEYISGKSGFPNKVKGVLVIREDGVQLRDNRGGLVITIPTTSITAVSNNVETDPGSFGRKMALGFFASKREEYLTIKTETEQGAEAIVFKCKKKTSEDISAKIDFFRKKLQPASQQ